MIRLLLVFHFSLCLAFTSRAQLTPPADSTRLVLGFKGTGNINKTSTGSSLVFHNALRFGLDRPKWTLNANSSWIYGQTQVRKTNNDFLFIVDADLFKSSRRLYYWGLAAYEKSFSLKILDRFQAGAGVGFHLLRKERAQLVLSDGPLFEDSYLREPDKYGRTRYETLRNSFRLKYRFEPKPFLILEGVNFLQNSFSDGQDYIIRTSNSLGIRINPWLALTSSVTYNRLNLTGTENFVFTYGLAVEKKF